MCHLNHKVVVLVLVSGEYEDQRTAKMSEVDHLPESCCMVRITFVNSAVDATIISGRNREYLCVDTLSVSCVGAR